MTGAPISADMLGFSGGGMTPMGTDTVPAMLTPGEFVMSRGAVNTFGSGFMEMINAAGGGTIDQRMDISLLVDMLMGS